MGITAFLEAKERLPEDSWRIALAFAFFVEGFIISGHLHEQHGIESVTHQISVYVAWWTALSLLISSLLESKMMLFHASAVAAILMKGLWFFYIGYVVYSGAYGPMGEGAMVPDLFTTAGLYAVICECAVAICLGIQSPHNNNGNKMMDVPSNNKGSEYEKISLNETMA